MTRRIFAPALVGLFAASLYFILNQFALNNGMIAVDEFYGEQFYSVIATLYAIITALLLVKGIDSFNALGASINDESMKIRSINAYFNYFKPEEQADGGESIRQMQLCFQTYTRNVLEQASANHSHKNDQVIDACLRHCANISVADENDRFALQEIMRGLDELRTLRSHRINCASQKIPEYLINMLALMTAAIMLPFYFLYEPGVGFNYYIIFMLGTFGSFIFFLLTDINKPYDGLWKIDFTPYEAAQQEVQASHTEWSMA